LTLNNQAGFSYKYSLPAWASKLINSE